MNMETNKIFAAVLVAGITAYFAAIGARTLIQPDHSGDNAYAIEVEESASAGGAVVIITGPEPIDALLATADLAKGQKLAKICAACHTFNKGGKNLVGPNLAGIVGSKLAGVPGFSYSTALKEAGGSWTIESLNKFLWKPKKAIPGTKMVFAGLKKPADRAAVIQWLKTQN